MATVVVFSTMVHLGVNIDHIATLRQARRGLEPDPIWGAVEAQLAGAQCITIHLREDRRHIQDHDLARLKQVCTAKLNLEMAATDAMVNIARVHHPPMATLVPEGRQEITTEGGLDVAGQLSRMKDVVAALRESGVVASAFIDTDPRQIEASAKAGFAYCEIHTGPYAEKFAKAYGERTDPALTAELARVAEAGKLIQQLGMRFNAGHALNYLNVIPIARLPGVRELHIGHSIVSRSVFVGFRQAVSEMLRLIDFNKPNG